MSTNAGSSSIADASHRRTAYHRGLNRLVLGRVGTAFAHKIVTVGDSDYTLRISRLNEPALVGEKNAVLLEIADGNAGTLVADILNLTASLTVGGRKRGLRLFPLNANQAGRYVADVIPIVRGIYTLRLGGYLGADPVSVPVDMDEVE